MFRGFFLAVLFFPMFMATGLTGTRGTIPPEPIDLGIAAKSISTYAGEFWIEDGAEVFWGVTRSGLPARLFRYNVATGKVDRTINIPEGKGGWGFLHLGNDIYVGTYQPAILYRYREGALQPIAELNQEFIWSMVERNGAIYISTSPDAKVYVYENEHLALLLELPGKYARSMAIQNDFLYIGTGTERAELYRYGLLSHELMQVFPENRSGLVYSLNVVDQALVAFLYPSGDAFRFDGKWQQVATDVLRSSVKQHGSLFYSYYGRLYRMDKDGIGPALSTQDENLWWIGAHALSDRIEAITSDGRYIEAGGKATEIDLSNVGLPMMPEPALALAAADGHVAVSGRNIWLDGHYIRPVGEPKALCFMGGYLYSANYTGAEVWRYEISNGHAEMIHRIGNQQNRPLAMACNDGKIAIGTAPDYGLKNGALTLFDGQWHTWIMDGVSPTGFAWSGEELYGVAMTYTGDGVDQADAPILFRMSNMDLYMDIAPGMTDVHDLSMVNGELWVAGNKTMTFDPRTLLPIREIPYYSTALDGDCRMMSDRVMCGDKTLAMIQADSKLLAQDSGLVYYVANGHLFEAVRDGR